MVGVLSSIMGVGGGFILDGSNEKEEKKDRVKIESERVKHWLSKGARPTLRVSRILGEVNFQDKKFVKWLLKYD